MTVYVISPSAIQDLNAIADYFLLTNVDVGENWFKEFNHKCQNLLKFPNMGKSYSYIQPDLRGLPLKGYIIFYRVENEVVEIVRIVNGRQDLTTLFSEN